MKIDILGTKYVILEQDPSKNKLLEHCDGYCDKTTKKIVIIKKPSDTDLENWVWYKNKVLRHEIIHAFLFESGLHGSTNWTDNNSEHPEQMVDWIAVQFPKIKKAFEQVSCI